MTLRLPTTLSRLPSAALEFAHGHYYTEKVSLHAMRDDGRSLWLRKILLPVPVLDRDSALWRQFVLLQTLPRCLRL